jgi:hypothetical protein
VESRLRLSRNMRVHFLILLAVPLYAQSISVGGKIGVPFNDPLGRAESRFYLVGPTVELQLPAGFAIEGSALYRRLGHSVALGYVASETPRLYQSRQRGNSWEFPVVGKYYFRDRERRWQPFLGTGWTLRTIGWSYEGTTTTTQPTGDHTIAPFKIDDRSGLNVGATATAGVRIRVGRFSLLPEVRYTRWGGRDGTFRPNEGGVFLGFRF